MKITSLRELDALIAEHFFGWKKKELFLQEINMAYFENPQNQKMYKCSGKRMFLVPHGKDGDCQSYEIIGDLDIGGDLPKYTTEMSLAWKITESDGWNDEDGYSRIYFKIIQHAEDWEAVIIKRVDDMEKIKKPWRVYHKDAKIAICLAALKAKGIEVELEIKEGE